MLVRWFAALAGALAICGGAAAATDGWTTYADPARGVRIDMPTTPEVSTLEKNEAYEITMVSATASGGFYALAISEFKSPLQGDIWEGLHAAVLGSAEKVGAVVVSEQRSQVDGQPAMEATFYKAENNMRVRTVLTIRDTRLFQAITLGQGAEPSQSRRFLDSLHFTDPLPG